MGISIHRATFDNVLLVDKQHMGSDEPRKSVGTLWGVGERTQRQARRCRADLG